MNSFYGKNLVMIGSVSLFIWSCSNSEFSGSAAGQFPRTQTTPPSNTPPKHPPSDGTAVTTDTGAVAKKICTVNPAYNPESVACSIPSKTTNSIWNHVSGWKELVAAFTDPTAQFISPLAAAADTRGRIMCPMVAEDLLVYVSPLVITTSGAFKVESIIDDQGSVRFWQNSDPMKETIINGNVMGTTVNLQAGKYAVVIDAKDTGKAATGMVFSIRDASNKVLHYSHALAGRPDSWCIFRTAAGTDLKKFIPDIARCRTCFGGP